MPFNGELLRLARQYRGFPQRDFARAARQEPSSISRYENRIVEPPSEFVRDAAAILDFPEAFFDQPDHVYGLPLSVHPMWRKKAVVSQRDIDRALAGLNIRMMHLRRLLRAIEFEPVLPLPELDIETYGGDTEAVATMVRRTWMMPAGPIDDLTAWIERAGCLVIHADLPDAAMDAVTLRTGDTPPCIFLNRHAPADRMRLSLAHELGHLVMHRVPTVSMEDEANAFAGAFLAPAKDIAPFFSRRRIDLPFLASLKPEWRMSMAALLYRAKELRYLDRNQERYLWQKFNVHKIRMREPAELDFPAERPTLMPSLISLHLDELGYSLAELASALIVHQRELVSLYEITDPEPPSSRPKLRIV